MVSAIVPSLFDGLKQGKQQPFYTTASSISLNVISNQNVIQFIPEGKIESFTTSFDVQTTTSGLLSLQNGGIDIASISFTTEGELVYTSGTKQIISNSITNDDFHRITLTHYAAEERLYFTLMV